MINKKVKTYFKKPKPKPEGSETESPVQEFLNKYLALKGLKNFRIPDLLFASMKWALIKKVIYPHVYSGIMKRLIGWPDNMVYAQLTDKYLIACPIECKSSTGKTHGKQKVMSKLLNYQIPRSPNEVVKIVEEFIKDAEKIRTILKEVESE